MSVIDNTVVIAELEDVLRASVTSMSADGVSATVDLESLAKKQRDLISQDTVLRANRPRVMRIDLSQGP